MNDAVEEWKVIASLFLEHYRNAPGLLVRKRFTRRDSLPRDLRQWERMERTRLWEQLEWNCPNDFGNLSHAAGTLSHGLNLVPFINNAKGQEKRLLSSNFEESNDHQDSHLAQWSYLDRWLTFVECSSPPSFFEYDRFSVTRRNPLAHIGGSICYWLKNAAFTSWRLANFCQELARNPEQEATEHDPSFPVKFSCSDSYSRVSKFHVFSVYTRWQLFEGVEVDSHRKTVSRYGDATEPLTDMYWKLFVRIWETTEQGLSEHEVRVVYGGKTSKDNLRKVRSRLNQKLHAVELRIDRDNDQWVLRDERND